MSAFKQNGHRLSQKQMPASKGNDCQGRVFYLQGDISIGDAFKATNNIKAKSEIAQKLKDGGVIISPTLCCNHEEADTTTSFHAYHVDAMFGGKDGKDRIVIKSDDTDVLVRAVHLYLMFKITKEVWVQTGSVDSLKITDNLSQFTPLFRLLTQLSSKFCISFVP
ncbi:unnamed protein product [Mytilus coruscus]|uniref:Uncharacterized protein n=1 Tax=Mytilus coruscus TaxID=42192 RepID=A0A6J8B1J3_MYTCO|nr:unnamed protein product [Mytilus coruscus]